MEEVIDTEVSYRSFLQLFLIVIILEVYLFLFLSNTRHKKRCWTKAEDVLSTITVQQGPWC